MLCQVHYIGFFRYDFLVFDTCSVSALELSRTESTLADIFAAEAAVESAVNYEEFAAVHEITHVVDLFV